MTIIAQNVSELGITCGYPEWKRDDDKYPDWDHSDECHETATSAILFAKTGKAWSFRCSQHRATMGHDDSVEELIFSDTVG